MTEKEKAQKGELYDANNDPQLLAEREICKDLCFAYNNLLPSKKEDKRKLINKIFGKTNETFIIEQPFFCDYGYNIEIGENFYANVNCIILDEAKVSFGNNVFIAPSCGFYTAEHPFDVEQRNKGLEYARPITVGNNVWIGAQSIILSGVTVGDNSIIGAGSVVTRDIPANVIAVGNPCRVLKSISQNKN
jgi:galactoside O-acetyltransferase